MRANEAIRRLFVVLVRANEHSNDQSTKSLLRNTVYHPQVLRPKQIWSKFFSLVSRGLSDINGLAIDSCLQRANLAAWSIEKEEIGMSMHTTVSGNQGNQVFII